MRVLHDTEPKKSKQVHLSYPLQDGYTSIMYRLNDKELLYGLAGLNRCILLFQ